MKLKAHEITTVLIATSHLKFFHFFTFHMQLKTDFIYVENRTDYIYIFFFIAGGFAFVYVAQDISNGKFYALKVG